MKHKRVRWLMVSLGLSILALILIAWSMPLADYADATFVGTNSYDRAGESVAVVGDVNGDGYDDFLIGARAGDVIGNNGGGVYLFLGEPGASWGSNVPVGNADATFGSAGYQDYAGHDVAGAGDVNGDGLDDFLVGADGYDTPGGLSQAGRVHLFFGRQAADWGLAFDVANSDASFVGEAAEANMGYALAGAGDVNGDGYDDFLFAAHTDDTDHVYLFLGSANPTWGNDASPATANASFVMEASLSHIDISVAGAGDVNGDGYSDLLIRSPGRSSAYLILGKEAADWGQDFDLDNADAILNTDSEARVAGAGDVNRDGLDDMLFGDPFADDGGVNSGTAYLLLGRQAADWGANFNLATNADASYLGANDDDRVGCAVSAAGDVNRDTYDDFLIGACYFDATGALIDSGAAYLVLGRPDGWEVDVDLADADTASDMALLPGEAAGDYAGTALAGGGDVNGDGFDDVLVGAYEHDRDVDTPDSGKVYLKLGTGLALDKEADGHLVEAGDLITYTLSYANTNPWTMQTVRIADDIPARTTYVSCSGGISCGMVGQTIWWNLGNVPAGGTGSVELVLQVLPDAPQGAFILNTAMITAQGHLNPVYSRALVRVGQYVTYLPTAVRAQP